MAAAGLTAVATPAAATGFDPTDWRTLPYTDLLEQGGWDYLSMLDHRWKYDRMQTNDTPIWQCSCTPAAFANVLDWQFALDGGPAETVPHALTPIHSWWDQTGPHVGAELLWSPTYVDAFLAKTSGYQDRGIGEKACGTYAYPWSLAKVGAAKAVEVSGTTVSAPSGITWTVHDTRASGLTDEVRNAIARELAAGRLVVAMRAAPAGPDEKGDMTYGGHGNLITGFDPKSKRLLAVDHGWKKGSSSQQGALRGKYDETYAEWEDSILEVFVYRTTTTTPTYTSLTGAPAGGSRTTTAPADYRLSVVRPDGARIGHDPGTGASTVVDGSYVHGAVLPDAQAGDGDGVVDHLPDAAYLREPQAGRWRWTVHGVTDGGYDLLLQDHVDGTPVERGRLTGTVQAGSQRKVEAVRAGDGTTTVTEVEQFGPEPVVDAPAKAASGAQVVLDGSRSFDADGSVASWSWDVGDGTVLDGRRVTHAFDAGTHRVVLTVTDDAGATTSTEHVLVVSPSDVTAPRLQLEPSDGDDWQRAPFEVTVSATDAGRGVRRLTARAEGASPAAERSGDGADLVVPVATEGRTTVVGRAVDRDGNDTGELRRTVGVDATAPRSSVTTPVAGGEVAALGLVAGPVLDATSGAARVEVSLVRDVDGRAWDGTGWVDGERWLEANVGSSAPDRWFLADGLPAGTALAKGGYRLRSRATDRAGNVEEPGSATAFAVADSALPQAEPVRLQGAGESLGVEAVDRDGTVVGVSHTRRRAVVWPADGGPRAELPPLPGHVSSWADDVLGGVVVGTSSGAGGVQRAVVWRDGVPTDLGLLPGAHRAAATGVDATGTAWGSVGYPDGRQVAVRFGADGPVELAGLGGAVTSLHAVSADGRWAVGQAQDGAGGHHPVRWRDGVPTALPDLGGARALAVNSSGEAAGLGSTGSHLHAVAWSADGTVRDLGQGQASDVDERGVVVGSSGRLGDTGNLVQAAAWQDGGLLRLDDTQPGGSPWQLITGSAISPEGGVVAGGGRDADGVASYRLQVARLSADPDLDTTAPTVAATPDDDTWRRGPVVLTVTASDADSGVASVTTSESGDVTGDRAEVPVEREGTTTVAYAATDEAGNASPVRTATVRIDRTAPEVRLAAGPQGWSRGPVVVPVSASDALSGLATLHYRVDDGAEVVVPDGGAGVEVSADGVHTVTAWAVDRAGNASEPVSREVRVDGTGPAVGIGPAEDGTTVERSTVLATVVTDAVSGLATSEVRHLVDGADAGDGGPAVVLRRDGEHRVEVTATDAAGNTTTRVLTVHVDGEPGVPATPSDGGTPVADAGGPYATTVGRPVVLDGSGSRGSDLVLRWSLPDREEAVEGTSVPWTPARAGRYVVELEAASGGRRSLPDLAVVEVTEPGADVSADAGDDVELVEGGTATLAGTVSEGATAAWVLEPVGEVDGSCALGAAGAASTTVRCDDEGSWRAVLTARDGDRSARDEVTVTVANADPTVTLDAPAVVRLGEPVQVRATPVDAGTGDELTCTLTWPGGGRHEGCTTTLALPGVGQHEVRVEVADGDGGTAAAVAPVAVRWAVELEGGGTVQAGQAVPVRLGLGGHHGMDVLRSAASVRLDAAGEPVGTEEAVPPGASELTWAAGADRYQWVWKTDRAWAGQTRALVLRLADGSEHRLVHRFR